MIDKFYFFILLICNILAWLMVGWSIGEKDGIKKAERKFNVLIKNMTRNHYYYKDGLIQEGGETE